MSGENSRHRAKVYCLNDDGQWDDRGTGQAFIQYIPVSTATLPSHRSCCHNFLPRKRRPHASGSCSRGLCLRPRALLAPPPLRAQEVETAFIMLMSEADGSSLVKAKVHSEDVYQRQQDTILSWNEPETGIDYALSFQEPDGCTELWEQICSLQGRDADRQPDAEVMGGQSQQQGGGQGGGLDGSGMGGGDAIVLPAAELRNLEQIADLFAEVPLMRRTKLAEMMLARDYVPQLVQLFSTVEDLEDPAELTYMFTIFKGVVMLNNTAIYEVLLQEDMLMGVVGALEYDPEVRCHKVQHRHFLREVARFQQVVPFNDPAVLTKVKQNFHIGFLKDVVLPRALDDNTFAALNQLQFFNNVQIISSLTNDPAFLEGLREKLMASAAPAEELMPPLKLLQELCSVTKTLQLYHRAAFYRKVVEHSYFTALAACLERPEPTLRLAAIDVLLASTLHDPSLLRTYVMQQRPVKTMMQALLRVLTSDDSSGEKPQIMEVLRALLDPEGMEGREQDDFLNLFYECHIHELAEPVAGHAVSGTGPMNGNAAALFPAPTAPK